MNRIRCRSEIPKQEEEQIIHAVQHENQAVASRNEGIFDGHIVHITCKAD